MNDRMAPKLSKWPFFLGDLLLVGMAGWIVYHYPHPLPTWPLFILVGCVAGGAWIAVKPFLEEYRAEVKFAEDEGLTTAVEQINNLRNLANQISFATAQWQVVQEHSGRTVDEARGIAEKMAVEARAFTDFMQKANDAEKAHLRVEVEKLRRGEGEWVQLLVLLLDHVYALYQAGVRSGQAALIGQLGNFQNACREAVRRVGLVPFEAKPDEPFNAQSSQLVDPEAKPPEGARVAATLAQGYTFQGQLIRRALVNVTEPAPDADLDVTEPVPDSASEAAPPESTEELPEEPQLPLGTS